MEEPRTKRQGVWTSKACDICGESAKLITLGNRTYQVQTRHYIFEITMKDVVCENCGFLFASSVPDRAFLFDYYKNAHHLQSEYQNIEPDFDTNARIQLIQEHLSEGNTVLEIGASTGAFCETLKSYGYDVIGLDPLDRNLKAVVTQSFVTGNIHGTDRGSNKPFDAVVSYYVLEHVTNARAWLQEAITYLRDNGVLIIEVPNFEYWPVESLNHEHFLHFTPFHLEKLLESVGCEVLAIETKQPSRYFGFVIVSQVSERREVKNCALQLLISDPDRSGQVELSKQNYRRAQEFGEEEDQRTRSLAKEIWVRIQALQPRGTKVYFWAANEYATDIACKLAEEGQVEMFIVDNSATKIGTFHEGFERPICAPVFETRDAHHRIFVLCSPAWNWQISNQIQRMVLEDITNIDAVKWKA